MPRYEQRKRSACPASTDMHTGAQPPSRYHAPGSTSCSVTNRPEPRDPFSPSIEMILSTSMRGSSGSRTLTLYVSTTAKSGPSTLATEPVANSMHMSRLKAGSICSIISALSVLLSVSGALTCKLLSAVMVSRSCACMANVFSKPLINSFEKSRNVLWASLVASMLSAMAFIISEYWIR